MISHRVLADLQVGIYQYAGQPTITWDAYDPGTDRVGVCWGLKRVDIYDVVVLRGSTTIEDWLRDFRTVADPLITGPLGAVHPGFHEGMEETRDKVLPLLSGRVIVIGHSLGAGRAAILSGLLITAGVTPLSRVVWGEPKPGFAKLATVLSAIPQQTAYRNGDSHGHDYVCDVPFTLPLQPYIHPVALTDVCQHPLPNDQWGIFSYHHMQLYRDAMPPPVAA